MFKQDKFKMGCVEEVHSQILELPYEGQELSMFILLPEDGTDLSVVSEPLAVSLSVCGSSLGTFL